MNERPRRKKDWVGLTVRARRELSNGQVRVPAGTRLSVSRNYGGLTVVSERCPHCGVKVVITKVPEGAVEIVE